MAAHDILQPGAIALQCGLTLPDPHLAYKAYGTLNAARDNAVLMPTFFGGQHGDTEAMIAPGRALDPTKLFIIVPDLLGNGLSSSPSNTAPLFDGPSFPDVTLYDNVACQHRLVTEHLKLERIKLVVGFSMGAQQAFQWGALYSDMVKAIAPICGSAKTSAHNALLLEMGACRRLRRQSAGQRHRGQRIGRAAVGQRPKVASQREGGQCRVSVHTNNSDRGSA